jgi:Ca-activated chloride channel homolog
MRKMLIALLVSLLGLNLFVEVALADGMVLPDAFNLDYVAVRYHRVTVKIEDNHATTHVEQEFYNPQSFTVSGQYLFPVPPDAILSKFQAVVDDQPQNVTRQSASATNAILFNAVAQRRDPSWLQFTDWETLAFNLTLPPGGARRMVLEYEQVLAPTGGLLHYRYILSTERYSSRPLEDVSIRVDLTSSAGLSTLYSSSHAIALQRDGANQAQVTWQAQNVQPTEDFDLFFAPAQGGFGGGLLTGQRGGQDHFLFLFAPEAETTQAARLPKDIVFVIDRSGSMGADGKLEQAKNALHYMLGRLNADDRFSIVGFDNQILTFSPTLQSIDDRALGDARRFVDDLHSRGSTDLGAALQTGLQIFQKTEARPDAVRLIIFLTDGLPTAGYTDEGEITRVAAEANHTAEARLHVFGVGYDVNSHLLDRLANDNGGSVTYVQPGENLELALSGFYEQIASPVLTNVAVTFEGLETSDLYPQHVPDMFQGSSLLLTGRYRATASTITVRVRGQAGDQPREYVYHFNLDQIGGHDFVPRLWATRKIGDLLDRVRVEGESAGLVEEIKALGLGYGVVTPYTLSAIAAQSQGAASSANMGLYGNQAALNQASGQTTIQARVQNQSYQQAAQANLAGGANVFNNGQNSIAQLSKQSIDLALLKGQRDLNAAITDEWIAQNIKVDRQVAFGSDEYFALAKDPAMRSFLQSGVNVIFAYQGQVIAVQETTNGVPAQPIPTQTSSQVPASPNASLLADLVTWLQQIVRTLSWQ